MCVKKFSFKIILLTLLAQTSVRVFNLIIKENFSHFLGWGPPRSELDSRFLLQGPTDSIADRVCQKQHGTFRAGLRAEFASQAVGSNGGGSHTR